ncbi:hypothetical protein BC826DRAFT_1006925, partial [Russula brevipes]
MKPRQIPALSYVRKASYEDFTGLPRTWGDALYVAQHVYHTKSVLEYLGSGGKMAGLSSVTLRPTLVSSSLNRNL